MIQKLNSNIPINSSNLGKVPTEPIVSQKRANFFLSSHFGIEIMLPNAAPYPELAFNFSTQLGLMLRQLTPRRPIFWEIGGMIRGTESLFRIPDTTEEQKTIEGCAECEGPLEDYSKVTGELVAKHVRFIKFPSLSFGLHLALNLPVILTEDTLVGFGFTFNLMDHINSVRYFSYYEFKPNENPNEPEVSSEPIPIDGVEGTDRIHRLALGMGGQMFAGGKRIGFYSSIGYVWVQARPGSSHSALKNYPELSNEPHQYFRDLPQDKKLDYLGIPAEHRLLVSLGIYFWY